MERRPGKRRVPKGRILNSARVDTCPLDRTSNHDHSSTIQREKDRDSMRDSRSIQSAKHVSAMTM